MSDLEQGVWYWVRIDEGDKPFPSQWQGDDWSTNKEAGYNGFPLIAGPRLPEPEELERLRETARLAERCAKSKGRHHGQHAMCDLMEHFGLACVRPGEDAPGVTCACGDTFPIDSYGAGFMAANGGVCENCDAAEGGGS
ncbi:hypothetical protein PRZ61_10580 [Halomonas pacifica]|uniref:hypothetical protein n=1 Tax=Bisbaumannia pacifica TaxID=77098 RepID=UPI0023599793|nr:hypothetical protein [Halomonas pacifica]MDC8803880.1 hypothetical protein [Halomonas pacifica]